MSLLDILVLVLIVLLGAYLLYRSFSKAKSDCCGCEGSCPMKSDAGRPECGSQPPPADPKPKTDDLS